MKWERILLPALLGIAASSAHAQSAVYFNPIVTRVSNSQADTGTFAYLGQGNKSGLRGGVSLGGYYMFGHGSKADFGVDVRDEWQRGGDALLNSFLIGVRAQGRVGERLKPYAQLSGGVGSTRAPFTAVKTSKAMFKVYGGLDYTIGRHLDFRAVEVGYGSLTTVNSAQYNSALTYSASRLLSFSSGLVARF